MSAHTGVLYDYVHRRQTLLQGHCNPITSCAVSADKRWIVTADAGSDSMVVVWDSYSGTPIKTIFTPHANGVTAVDLSPDAMLIATLGETSAGLQEVSVWEWTVDHDGALYTRACPTAPVEPQTSPSTGSPASTPKSSARSSNHTDTSKNRIPSKYTYTSIQFNGGDVHEFITTSPQRVTFWSWAAHKLEFRTPAPLEVADFGAKIGDFTHSIFLYPTHSKHSGPARAVSGTTEGNLVLWEVISGADGASVAKDNDAFVDELTIETKTTTMSDMPARVGVKVVKLNRNGGIPFMTMCDDLLVVCGTDESVRFYDMDFRIVAWYEDLEAGPINSVSFANTSQLHYIDVPVNEASQAAVADQPQMGDSGSVPGPPNSRRKSIKHGLPDFVVGSTRALLVGVDAAIFDEPSSDNRHGTLLLQGFDGDIAALCTHPMESYFVAVSKNGVLQGWDYEEHRLEIVKVLHPDDNPSCLAFSPDGAFLAVGFANGMVRLLRWGTTHDLAEVACFQICHGIGLTKIKFSLDGRFLGVADLENAVGIYRFIASDVVSANGQAFTSVDHMRVNRGKRKGEAGPGLEPGDGSEPRNGWTYLGRYISHTAPVTCLTFGLSAEGNNRFFSTACDGTLVEYDLDKSSVVDGIQLVADPAIIEQGNAYATCCVVQAATRESREDTVICSNSAYKLKVFNSSTYGCRKTTLGPTFGGPITNMEVLGRKVGSRERDVTLNYLAYTTDEKVIGLVKMPLDGNPFKSMGLIAHPGEISGFAVSFDGRFLITAGGSDMAINLWTVNTAALDVAAMSSGNIPSVTGVPKSLLPYMPLLDPTSYPPGERSAVYEDIVDFFYYAQIRCQGEETTSPRRAEGTIPLHEISNFMRALSFYPTEQQIEDMCSEIRYSDFVNSAQTKDRINLEDLVRLYLNHRPVVGPTLDEIQAAFATIEAAQPQDSISTKLNWNALQSYLADYAETMPSTELQSYLTMLIGRSAVEALKPSSKITPEQFCSEVLGLFENRIEDLETYS